MANVKLIEIVYSDLTRSIYCTVIRRSDGFILDSTTGNFTDTPISAFLELIQSGPIGLFSVSESRSVWTDGLYTILFYQQLNVGPFSPNPNVDLVLASGQMQMLGDLEIVLDDFVSTKATQISLDNMQLNVNDLVAEARGKWVLDPVGLTLTLYELDGITIMQKFSIQMVNGIFVARTPI